MKSQSRVYDYTSCEAAIQPGGQLKLNKSVGNDGDECNEAISWVALLSELAAKIF
jgi:hypothetical protein